MSKSDFHPSVIFQTVHKNLLQIIIKLIFQIARICIRYRCLTYILELPFSFITIKFFLKVHPRRNIFHSFHKLICFYILFTFEWGFIDVSFPEHLITPLFVVEGDAVALEAVHVIYCIDLVLVVKVFAHLLAIVLHRHRRLVNLVADQFVE
jgi:hypothetical protein